MAHTHPNYQSELNIAVSASRAAGEIVRDSYAKLSEKDIGEKGLNDMVTVVDHQSQALVVNAIRKNFKDDYIIAEENLDPSVNQGRDANGSRRWYIDPLDGTTNYIHAYPMFAVNIALEVDRELVVGVTYAPRNDELFRAVRGHGAFVNDAPMRVSAIDDHNRMLLGTGFPFRARQFLDIYLESFAYFFNRSRGIRRAGSAALDFAYVAAGRLDGFWEMTLSPWDMAAGVVLIEEAGGRVSDFHGERNFLSTGHVAATNGLFHDWMTTELRRLFPPGGHYSV